MIFVLCRSAYGFPSCSTSPPSPSASPSASMSPSSRSSEVWGASPNSPSGDEGECRHPPVVRPWLRPTRRVPRASNRMFIITDNKPTHLPRPHRPPHHLVMPLFASVPTGLLCSANMSSNAIGPASLSLSTYDFFVILRPRAVTAHSTFGSGDGYPSTAPMNSNSSVTGRQPA